MVPSIIDVWGYDREFCSSSSSPSSSSSLVRPGINVQNLDLPYFSYGAVYIFDKYTIQISVLRAFK